MGWVNLENFENLDLWVVDNLTSNLTTESYGMNFGFDPLNENKPK